ERERQTDRGSVLTVRERQTDRGSVLTVRETDRQGVSAHRERETDRQWVSAHRERATDRQWVSAHRERATDRQGVSAHRERERDRVMQDSWELDRVPMVTLIPEEPEDMWHTYNLLQVGDSLRASTIRKVQTESSTGSVGSSRVRTTLTISVETIDFDTQACQLRVKGTNIQENEFVRSHTVLLLLRDRLTVCSSGWDRRSHTVLLLLRDRLTVCSSGWDRRSHTVLLLLRDRLTVCSSGWDRRSHTVLLLLRDRLTVCSSGWDRRSHTVCSNEPVSLSVVKCVVTAAGEVKTLEDFYKMLQHEPDRAFYG
ncbi:PELO protein, partial [Atractosteus spatula]|nr:PELO protein [Atractosteus spatula]